jgi:hypothetical protein
MAEVVEIKNFNKQNVYKELGIAQGKIHSDPRVF